MSHVLFDRIDDITDGRGDIYIRDYLIVLNEEMRYIAENTFGNEKV